MDPRGQALPKANYDNRAPFFVRQGIQFRVSWDNPSSPFRGSLFDAHPGSRFGEH